MNKKQASRSINQIRLLFEIITYTPVYWKTGQENSCYVSVTHMEYIH